MNPWADPISYTFVSSRGISRDLSEYKNRVASVLSAYIRARRTGQSPEVQWRSPSGSPSPRLRAKQTFEALSLALRLSPSHVSHQNVDGGVGKAPTNQSHQSSNLCAAKKKTFDRNFTLLDILVDLKFCPVLVVRALVRNESSRANGVIWNDFMK